MKIRLIPKEYIENAYSKKNIHIKTNLKEESVMNNMNKLPRELFLILGETLSFIENVNNMEGREHENK